MAGRKSGERKGNARLEVDDQFHQARELLIDGLFVLVRRPLELLEAFLQLRQRSSLATQRFDGDDPSGEAVPLLVVAPEARLNVGDLGLEGLGGFEERDERGRDVRFIDVEESLQLAGKTRGETGVEGREDGVEVCREPVEVATEALVSSVTVGGGQGRDVLSVVGREGVQVVAKSGVAEISSWYRSLCRCRTCVSEKAQRRRRERRTVSAGDFLISSMSLRAEETTPETPTMVLLRASSCQKASDSY